MWFMEIPDDDHWAPKRGDLIYTGMKTSKPRTWIILRVTPRKSRIGRRFNIWKERWWDLTPRLRRLVFESAQRNGGQTTWNCEPLPKKRKKLTFEQYMGAR